MPGELADGLGIAACLPREDVHDVLVTRRGTAKEDIHVLGTSSLRRQCQVSRYLSDVEVKDLRGNVPTRIRKLKEGEYDAIILAAAGIRRLGIDEDPELNYEYIDFDDSIPAAGQGIIAIESKDSGAIHDIAAKLNRPDSMTRLMTERKFMRVIGADCHDAVAAYSELSPLIDRLQEQKLTIQDQMDELKYRQKEFSALTEGMEEGFLIAET